MTVRVFAALADDAQQGWVWSDYRSSTRHRPIVRIKNEVKGKSVYCEHLQLDHSFIRRYNKAAVKHRIDSPAEAIVLNAWYRSKLGYRAQEEIWSISTTDANTAWGRFRACTDHPQVVVRVSAWLGLISLCLGVIGTALGTLSLF